MRVTPDPSRRGRPRPRRCVRRAGRAANRKRALFPEGRARPQASAGRRRSAGGGRRVWSDFTARVEGVAKAVADEVDRQHDDEDGRAREEHPVWRDVEEVRAVEQDAAPGWNVARETESEERQRRLGEDRTADTDGRGDE